MLIGAVHPGRSRMGKRRPDRAKIGYSSPSRKCPTARHRIASGAKNMPVAHSAATAKRSEMANHPGSAIAIGYPKGQSAAVVEFCREFIADVKASGFVQKAIDRMGSNADGVVVLTP